MRHRLTLLAAAALGLAGPVALCDAQQKPAAAPAKEKENAVEAAEEALLLEMGALWDKVGPHADKGTKLAKDNRRLFEVYYRSCANQLAGEKPQTQLMLFALQCMPTAYGWPTYRDLGKDIKYTGLIPVVLEGDYEVTMDARPAKASLKIVLEIDGEPTRQAMTPNKTLRVNLKKGVRALTVRTEDDIRIFFGKLELKHLGNK